MLIFQTVKCLVMQISFFNEINIGKEMEIERSLNYRQQKYRKEWENVPEFINWLQPVLNATNLTKCIFCNCLFGARLQTIKDHSRSIRHRRELNRVRMLEPNNNVNDIIEENDREILKTKVDKAKLNICAIFAEHNLAFLLADHLLPVLKKINDDVDCREIWQNLHIDQKNVQKIIKSCLATGYKTELCNILRKSKFAVLFDETTDISQVQTACIVVQYLDFEQKKVICTLWEILLVLKKFDDNHEAGAGYLYHLITASFVQSNVPLQNIVAFGSDGCNSTMGLNNSVAQRFQRDNPSITIIKCPSHSIHLCAENAIKQLPDDITQFCTSLHGFFCRSPKRQHTLVEFQVFLDTEIHKILRSSSTRWLSMKASVGRILEQWNVLELFFTDAHYNEKIPNAEIFLNFFKSESQKCYILFLNFVLPKINKVNKFFQRKDIIIHKIQSVLTLLYKEMAGLFLQRSYVVQNNPSDIDPFNEEQFVGFEMLNLGSEVNELINLSDTPNFGNNSKAEIKICCLQYLQELCRQLKRRFNNFQDNYYDTLHCISPENTLSPDFRDQNCNIMQIVKENNHCMIQNYNDKHSIINQYKEIIYYTLPNDITNPNIEISKFWFSLYFFEDNAREYPFRILASFVLNLLVIPHSNAEPERVWSKEKIMKTALRNKLHVDTVNSLLLASQCIKLQNANCKEFEPTPLMLRLLRNINDTDNVDNDDE
ncbi:uncharacterized protein [Prorops nasuta]|uniref:uncharacterized protein n=1 Tax=Prorops nasuta TaxID=863751 RepID=UPI0034CEAC96